jgi:hypothetical protein
MSIEFQEVLSPTYTKFHPHPSIYEYSIERYDNGSIILIFKTKERFQKCSTIDNTTFNFDVPITVERFLFSEYTRHYSHYCSADSDWHVFLYRPIKNIHLSKCSIG